MQFGCSFPVYLLVIFLALTLVAAQAQTRRAASAVRSLTPVAPAYPGTSSRPSKIPPAQPRHISSSAGDFNYTNLPVGSYTVTVTAPGFSTAKYDKVSVAASYIYELAVKLAVASSSQTVEVTADAMTLDTTNDTQSTVLPQVSYKTSPIADAIYPDAGTDARIRWILHGRRRGCRKRQRTRSNSVNWQIEGTDNNDLWWNIPAVNQGGVNSIAGVIFPVDAIDNFSFETSGSTGLGRNSAARPTSPSSQAPTRFTAPSITSITTNPSRHQSLHLPSSPKHEMRTTDSRSAAPSLKQ